MKVLYATSKQQKKAFSNFRKKLYKNDPYYVSTIEFTCDALLHQTDIFSKTCNILPVMIVDIEVLCEALLIKAPNDDFVQIAFFESLDNQEEAVEILIEEAKKFASNNNVKKIIIGLNGHLSYGVGLSVDMKRTNTFDSTYTKLYYPKYFSKYSKYELVAFSNSIEKVFNKIPDKGTNIEIRPINLKEFENEMEKFRLICDRTIGQTFLYSKTNKKHFEELMSGMKFFLKPENILFAYYKNQLVGFAFWHPDYNEILKPGKYNSILMIAFRYIFFKNRIKRVKLNSIGVDNKYQGIVTIKLLKEISKYIRNYDTIETNFVWCNNQKSMKINEHVLENIERRFIVYEVNL